MLLARDPRGHVPGDALERDQGAVFGEDRGASVLSPADRPVTANPSQDEGSLELVRRRRGEGRAVGDQGPIVGMDELLPQRRVVEELGGAVPRDGLCRRAHVLEHRLRRQPDAVEDVRAALDEEAEARSPIDPITVGWN